MRGDTGTRARGDAERGLPFSLLPLFLSPRLQIALIVLIAIFFRLWLIDRIPPGLFGDEATDGLDALDVLAGRGAVFFPANFGREGLHMWLVAGMFKLLGVTPLALRLPSAIAGILTAAATYWLGRELVGASVTWKIGKRLQIDSLPDSADPPIYRPADLSLYRSIIPLLAALYLATSYWHVHFSRFGIRGVFTPLCGALAFAAFWRGVNQRSNASRSRITPYAWFALSGLFFGLATHFYTASRFFPFFLGGFLLLQTLVAYATGRRAEALLVRHFWGIALLYLVAALVFAPLGLYFLQHPGSFAQRASEVVATQNANPLGRMVQAAAANVLQFFIPGRGDPAQFYNQPGRAVFDLLTAALALIGIAALARRWKRPAALFLLTWFPALLLPSFLATDRFPTLPRVLGVIPGVYFFPAIGLWVVALLLTSRWKRGGAEDIASTPPSLRSSAPLLLVILALTAHAGLTYRDYFRTWGPAQATFDAFEGDMTAAWRWLAAHRPGGHVYLSSDLYRHPTFMLLSERATVQTYFQHRNPNLSWFDARTALPLPPAGQPATYLLGASAPLSSAAAAQLAVSGIERDRVPGPDGSPALTVIEWPAGAEPRILEETGFLAQPFTDRLTLIGAAWESGVDGAPKLRLTWRTAGPDATNSAGYRLEIAAGAQTAAVQLDAFRPLEWVTGGTFITWSRPAGVTEPVACPLRLRLWRSDADAPLTQPDAPDGWREVTGLAACP